MSQLIITGLNQVFSIYSLKTGKKLFVKRQFAKLQSPHLNYTDSPKFRDFGIEIDKKHIYIATHDKVAIFDKKSYKYLSLLPVKSFVNTHQILKVKDIFYIANSANDSIGIFDLKNQTSKYLDIRNFKIVKKTRETTQTTKYDKHHVNSLYEHKGKIYFCLNNRGNLPSGYYIYDPETEITKTFATAGLYGHGIVIVKNDLYTLSTGTSELLKINLKSKKVTAFKIGSEEIFLRGLVEYKGKLLIGNSSDYSQPKKIRAFISEFDLTTHKHTCLINLSLGGIIFDIKVLP